MNGLYALKPRFSQRLTATRRRCIASGVTPAQLTWTGVGAGAVAGIVVALLGPGWVTAVLLGSLVVTRLACANLDGGVARQTGTATRWGAVENELGDRLADLAMLAGLAVAMARTSSIPIVGGVQLGALLLLASTLPSWVALAVSSAGGTRVNGGVMGKTERCAVVVLGGLTGWYGVAAAVITLGSVWTAAMRLAQGASELRRATAPPEGVR